MIFATIAQMDNNIQRLSRWWRCAIFVDALGDRTELNLTEQRVAADLRLAFRECVMRCREKGK